MDFSHLYNSKNIRLEESIIRHHGIFCQYLKAYLVPAAKWMINQDPESDRATMNLFVDLLKTVTVKTFILISTIDVYGAQDHTGTLDEDSVPNPDNTYGKHRYEFEILVRDIFPNCHVIRLPGLFGQGLKKNFINDLLKNYRTSFILPNSSFQWFDMSALHHYLDLAVDNNIPLINLFPSPIATSEILKCARLSGFVFDEPAEPEKKGACYNVKTKYGKLVQSQEPGYIYGVDQTFANLKSFFIQERICSSLGVSCIGWNYLDIAENETILNFLQAQRIRNIEIAPMAIWGSWEAVRKALSENKITEFASKMQELGFKITSMQGVHYQQPDVQLFANNDTFVEYFKFLIDVANALSLNEHQVRIVFGSPKNRNPLDNTEPHSVENMAIAERRFREICDYASDKNVIVLIEANPPAYGCHFLNTLPLANEFVNKIGSSKLKMMVDTGCAALGQETLDNLDPMLKNIAHIHLSQPNLKPFPLKSDFTRQLDKILPALHKEGNWVIETRNTSNVQDFMNTVLNVKENLTASLAKWE